ncbi:MAG: hypothetical protein IIU10_04365 [Paludibacteraceae bacterium]|nr:hypothetical protein [Paludibacteraceae bacterium]
MVPDIAHFEQTADAAVVKRGRSLFRKERVTQFSEEDGEVRAVVQDGEDYTVSMELSPDGVIRSHRCNCPYDEGVMCVHEAAVLYMIREKRHQAAHRTNVTDVIAHMKAPKRALWEEALDELLAQAPKGREAQIVPVQVRTERAYLHVEHQGDRLVFSSNVQLDPAQQSVPSPCIIAKSPTEYVLIPLTPYEQQVYSTLLRLGSVPKEAERKVKELLATIEENQL